MSIRMIIDVVEHGEDAVAVNVHTDPFDGKKQTEHVGEMWVGICLAINEYAHSRGMTGFDCLKAHRVSG